MADNNSSLLDGGLRALDLTDEKGFLCGKVLADLGVEVIKIEKPGGNKTRRREPFWLAYNTNKKSLTLDVSKPEGQTIFKRLAQKAEFVIESFPPGKMDALGLGYAHLSQLNPGIILTSISPFGQDGPYSAYQGSDLIASAMGGTAFLTGDPDRAPVRVSFPLICTMANLDAAAGTLIAHYYRELSGRGQQVDVSFQHSGYDLIGAARLYWEEEGRIERRAGVRRGGFRPGVQRRYIWPCQDGFVAFYLQGGVTGERASRTLTGWMASENAASDYILGVNWETFDIGSATAEEVRQIEEAIELFFRSHTKEELLEGAIKHRVLLLPVREPEEAVNSPQLLARQFWSEAKDEGLGKTLLYPATGAFFKSSAIFPPPLSPAPLIGEHNNEIYAGELGFSQSEISSLKARGVI